jgi:diacylglycerol kinase family enzyme
MEFFRSAWRIYSGTHLKHKKISLLRGKTIEVFSSSETDPETLIEVDGEQLGSVPAAFSITPRVLPVKCFL